MDLTNTWKRNYNPHITDMVESVMCGFVRGGYYIMTYKKAKAEVISFTTKEFFMVSSPAGQTAMENFVKGNFSHITGYGCGDVYMVDATHFYCGGFWYEQEVNGTKIMNGPKSNTYHI